MLKLIDFVASAVAFLVISAIVVSITGVLLFREEFEAAYVERVLKRGKVSSIAHRHPAMQQASFRKLLSRGDRIRNLSTGQAWCVPRVQTTNFGLSRVSIAATGTVASVNVIDLGRCPYEVELTKIDSRGLNVAPTSTRSIAYEAVAA